MSSPAWTTVLGMTCALMWACGGAAPAAPSNTAGPPRTIVEVSGRGIPGGPIVVQQAVTIPAGPAFNSLRFRFLQPSNGPTATGNLYLLSQVYLGRPSDVGASMPNFVARSLMVDSGDWVFDPVVEVQPGTTYMFVSDTDMLVPLTDGTTDIYPGGDLFTTQRLANGPFTLYTGISPAGRSDVLFLLSGRPVAAR